MNIFLNAGFIHVMENLEKMEKNIFVMEFYFSGKVIEMTWNFTKMSWKKYVFTNSIIRKKNIWYIF